MIQYQIHINEWIYSFNHAVQKTRQTLYATPSTRWLANCIAICQVNFSAAYWRGRQDGWEFADRQELHSGYIGLIGWLGSSAGMEPNLLPLLQRGIEFAQARGLPPCHTTTARSLYWQGYNDGFAHRVSQFVGLWSRFQ